MIEQKLSPNKPALKKPSAARFVVLPLVFFMSNVLLHVAVWDMIARIGYNLTAKVCFIMLESLISLPPLIFFLIMQFRVKISSKLLLFLESLVLAILPIASFVVSTIIFGLALVFSGVTA